MLINSSLERLMSDGVTWDVQAFADDVLIEARNRVVSRFAEIFQPVLEVIQRWAKECSLDFSYD